jgi:hypothetical protein
MSRFRFRRLVTERKMNGAEWRTSRFRGVAGLRRPAFCDVGKETRHAGARAGAASLAHPSSIYAAGTDATGASASACVARGIARFASCVRNWLSPFRDGRWAGISNATAFDRRFCR